VIIAVVGMLSAWSAMVNGCSLARRDYALTCLFIVCKASLL
jgi:hypothetical protein